MHIALIAIEGVLVTLCLVVSIWLLRQRKQMKFRTHLGLQACAVIVLGATLVSMIFPGTLQRLARATSTAGAGCNDQNSSECFTGTNLNGRDPGLYNCWNHDASIINVEIVTNKSGDKVGTVRIWYSYACQTNWAQVIGGLDTVVQDKSDKLPVVKGVQTTDEQRGSGQEPYGIPLYAPPQSGKPLSVACSFGQHLQGSNNEVIQWDIHNIKVSISAPGTAAFASPTIDTSETLCTATSPMVYAPVDPATAEVSIQAQAHDDKNVTESIGLEFSQNGTVDRFPTPTPQPELTSTPPASATNPQCFEKQKQTGWFEEGEAGATGKSDCIEERVLQITGSGTLFKPNSDYQSYDVYRKITGNWTIKMHVGGLQNNPVYGVMLTTDPSHMEQSTFSLMLIDNNTKQLELVDKIKDSNINTEAHGASGGGWFVITREGTTVTMYFQADNDPSHSFKKRATLTDLPDTVFAGMLVAKELAPDTNTSIDSAAVFENIDTSEGEIKPPTWASN